jgi:hypothetical protein
MSFEPDTGRYLPQWLAALVSWQMLPYIDITASFLLPSNDTHSQGSTSL